MYCCEGIDELSSDPHTVRCFAYTAFKHVPRPQLTPDLLHINRAALVGEARIASDHEQRPEARKRRDDLLDYPVCKILLFGVTTHVLERQYRNRRLVGQRERFPCCDCGRAARDAEHTHWPLNVLQLMLAEIIGS